MAKYMLLLHDDPSSFATMSPEQIQKVIEKYMAWGSRLKQAGVLSASNKLTDEPGKVMRGKGGNSASPTGPTAKRRKSSAATTWSRRRATTARWISPATARTSSTAGRSRFARSTTWEPDRLGS